MVLFDSAMEKKGGKEQKKAAGRQAASSQGAKKMWEGMALMLHFPSPCSKQQHKMCWTGGSWLRVSALELEDSNGSILGI